MISFLIYLECKAAERCYQLQKFNQRQNRNSNPKSQLTTNAWNKRIHLKKESKDIQIIKTCWQRGEQLQSIEHGGYKHEGHSVKIAISNSQRNLPSHKESLVRKTLSLSICAPAYPYRVFFLRHWDDASIILYYFPVPSKRLKQL